MRFAASPPGNHGTLCKFFKMPVDCCYKIPNSSSDSRTGSPGPAFGLDEAVLLEPLSVATHSVRQASVRPGDCVVVFGAGTIGLLCAAVAREFGAGMVTSVDISREKLEFAKRFVPDGKLAFETFLPDQTLSSEEDATRLRDLRHGESALETDVPGYDVAIEATGAESCIQMAIHALRVGGSFVQTGLGKRNVNFPISTVSENEIEIRGCFRYGPGDYRMALELALSGKIPLKSLITKIVPFEEIVEAWETTRRGEGIKTLIRGAGFMDDTLREG